MRNLGDTVSRLAAQQARRASAFAAGGPGSGLAGGGTLTELADFGSNPGALKARCYVPPGLREGAPLVVVLHGCSQTAAGYDAGSGWSTLAKEAGFAVLYPEQARENNANLCFNWFAPADIRHGSGETLSIRQMIDAMVQRHGLDRRRIHITGLSAGGAMAMVLLATAPEVFAGGAIIAGVPFGSAASMPEAFDRMRGVGLPDGTRVAQRVRDAAQGDGPWPRVSVWQGDADTVVDPANADAIVNAWLDLHGLSAAATRERVNGHERLVWTNSAGAALVESYTVRGMGHGTPVTVRGAEACGTPMPYMLEAGISSTRRIAAFWGLTAMPVAAAEAPEDQAQGGIEAVIGRALRQAGLMR